MKKEMFNVPTPKHIHIGDPFYENNAAAKRKYTVNHRIQKECRIATVTVMEESKTYGDMTFTDYRIRFVAAPDKETADVYNNDMYYTGQGIRRTFKELGCDTARFEIVVDGRFDEYCTGSDGFYGDFATYSPGLGTAINLYLDSDMVTFEETVQLAKHWFGYNKEQKKCS